MFHHIDKEGQLIQIVKIRKAIQASSHHSETTTLHLPRNMVVITVQVGCQQEVEALKVVQELLPIPKTVGQGLVTIIHQKRA